MVKSSLFGKPCTERTASAASPRWVLKEAKEFLREQRIREPEASSEWLLAEACGVPRAQLWLLQEIPNKFLNSFWRQINLLAQKRIPISYLLGHQNFMGLDIKVRPKATLIPRPETEELVEKVIQKCRKEFARGSGISIADVGTGSGCIILALRQALADDFLLNLWANDISPSALKVARLNDQRTGRQGPGAPFIHWRAGSLLTPFPSVITFNVIVANLPYVRRGDYDNLEPEIRLWEPREALVAGPNGLALIGRLITEAGRRLAEGGFLALEFGDGQLSAIKKILRQRCFRRVEAFKDFNRQPRFIMAAK